MHSGHPTKKPDDGFEPNITDAAHVTNVICWGKVHVPIASSICLNKVRQMEEDQISRVRNFSRSVAVEVGAPEDSFLNRGRPPGAARVLNAVGLGYEHVSELRAFLKLDTGLLSRLLRGLEAEGLIDTKLNPKERRSSQ